MAKSIIEERKEEAALGSEMAKKLGKIGGEYLANKQRESARRQLNSQTTTMKTVLEKQRMNFNENLKLQDKMSKIDKAATTRLLEREKQFSRDKTGRKILSERQIIDWMNSKARTEEEWKEFAATQEDIHKKNMKMLEVIYDRISQSERQLMEKFGNNLSNDVRENIARKKAAIKQQISESENEAKNNGAIVSGLMTVGGALIASGNPIAMAAGATTIAGATAYSQGKFKL